MANYRCLGCGETTGEQEDGSSDQTWYWRCFPYGRIGPFCQHDCAADFSTEVKGPPSFTVEQIGQLVFLRWLWNQGIEHRTLQQIVGSGKLTNEEIEHIVDPSYR